VKEATGEKGFEEVTCLLAGAGAPADKREEARIRLLEFSPTGKLPALLVLVVVTWLIYVCI